MSNQQYKNVGKKQIISVVSQTIQKVEAIEMTLNLLIMMLDKEGIVKSKDFNDFMEKTLGGKDEPSKDGGDNPKGDIATDNKDS